MATVFGHALSILLQPQVVHLLLYFMALPRAVAGTIPGVARVSLIEVLCTAA